MKIIDIEYDDSYNITSVLYFTDGREPAYFCERISDPYAKSKPLLYSAYLNSIKYELISSKIEKAEKLLSPDEFIHEVSKNEI